MKHLLLHLGRIILIALLVTLAGLAGWGLVDSAGASGAVDAGAGYWYGLSRSAAADKVYLPLLLRDVVAAPDLRVGSLAATSGEISLVIRNAGSAPVSDAFWVDVYFNPNPAPPAVIDPAAQPDLSELPAR